MIKLAALIQLFSMCLLHAQGYGKVTYLSPDGQTTAIISPSFVADHGFFEHSMEIQDHKMKTVFKVDFSSKDYEHGRNIVRAGWTPDSKFFVFSTSSSGGHSSWHFPVAIYVRSLKKMVNLEDFIENSVVNPNFYFSKPAIFHGTRNNCLKEKKSLKSRLPLIWI